MADDEPRVLLRGEPVGRDRIISRQDQLVAHLERSTHEIESTRRELDALVDRHNQWVEEYERLDRKLAMLEAGTS
jgi:ribosomal 50S subunit-associated protein YjgA (DUF615 family)